MTLSSLVEDWNNDSDFKFSTAELKKPTSSFLLEILQSFLSTVYKIDCGMVRAKMDERRFKIHLVKFFNDFFKACKVPHELLYVDFLQTDSKKVIPLLIFLLHYRQFFKAVTAEISENANNKIEEYNQLLSKKVKMQIEQEERKIRTGNKEAELKESARLITDYKKSAKDLEAKSLSLKENIETVEQQSNQISDEIINLGNDINELQCLVVTDDEVQHLQKKMKAADDEIAALNYAEKIALSRNEVYSKEMCELNTEIEELSAIANEKYVLDLVEKYRTDMKAITEMNAKEKDLENQIKESKAKVLEIIEKDQILEGELEARKNKLNSLLGSNQTKMMVLESEYKLASIRNSGYAKKLEEAELKVQNLKVEQDDLVLAGIEIVEHIKNTRI
ncbi:hypothetical protein Bhyg_08656, partial [Pseudolycoriella hygida]